MAVIVDLAARIRSFVSGKAVSFDPQRGDCRLRDEGVGLGPQIVFWNSGTLGAQPSEGQLLAIGSGDLFTATNLLSRSGAQKEFIGSRVMRALGGVVVDELNILRRQVIAVGTFAWDPANLVTLTGLTRADIAVSGVTFGDFVEVTAPYSLQGVLTQAYVQGSGMIGVRLQNQTVGTVNLANGTWNYVVWRVEQMAPRTDAQARNAVLNRIDLDT